jgi:cyclin-dependent kinase regulatory subunit CKS1
MVYYPDEIEYSDKYSDDLYEYRHVILPKPLARDMYKIAQLQRVLVEAEWRGLGVCQTRGWVHYEIHRPEPHILLFRRPHGTDPQTGEATARVLTVTCSWHGGVDPSSTEHLVHISCTNIAGEELYLADLPANQPFAKVAEQLSLTFKLAPERLHLILPSGDMLDPNSGTAIANFVN